MSYFVFLILLIIVICVIIDTVSLSKLKERLIVLEMIMTQISNKMTRAEEAEYREFVKKPGANRNPRTEEQKRFASLKRKEWWDKKKASEGQKKLSDAAVQLPKEK